MTIDISEKWMGIRLLVGRHIVPICLFFILSLIVHRKALFGEGIYITGDLVRPITLDGYSNYFYPMWNFEQSTPTLSRLPQLIIMIPLIFIANLFGMSTGDFLKMEMVTIWAFSGISMFYVTRFFLEEKDRPSFQITSASTISGLFFAWNGFMIAHMFHPMMRITLALSPILFLCLWKGFKENKYRFLLLSGVLWTLSCGAVHWMVYGGILAGFIYISFITRDIINNWKSGLVVKIINIIKRTGQFALVLFFFLITSAYWILPGYLMGSTSRYGNVVTIETLEKSYESVDTMGIISFDASQVVTSRMFETNDSILGSSYASTVFLVMGIFLMIISLSSPFFQKKRHMKLLLIIIAFLSILQTLMMTLYPHLGSWFILEAPLHSVYGWAFRTPKFLQFLYLSSSFLIGFSTFGILSMIKNGKLGKKGKKWAPVSVIFTFLIICSIIVPNWPLATGDYNQNLFPSKIHPDISRSMEWIESKEGNFKVLWVPDYRSEDVDWNLGVRTNKDIISLSSPKSTYYFDDRHTQSNGYGIYYIENLFSSDHKDSLVYRNVTDKLGSILFPLGIKYVVFHDDNATTRGNEHLLLQNLYMQHDMKLVSRFGKVYIFENCFSPLKMNGPFLVSNNEFFIYDGISSIDTLYSIPGYDPSISIPLYAEQKNWNLDKIEDHVDVLYLNGGGSFNDILLSMIPNKYWIKPFDSTLHSNNPKNFWSKELTEDMVLPSIVRRSGSSNREWSYSSDFTYTVGEGKIIQNNEHWNDIYEMDLENGINPFSNGTSKFKLEVTDNPMFNQSSIVGTGKNGENGNTIIAKTELIPILYGKGYYNLTMVLSFENALSFQIKAIFYDKEGKKIEKAFLTTSSGSKSYTKYTQLFDLPTNVGYMQVSILSDQHPIKDTTWSLSEFKISNIQKMTKPNRLKMDFNIESSGDHSIFLRHFNGPEGGIISVGIDEEKPIRISTNSQYGEYIWTDLRDYNLNRGKHEIIIDNVEGFNSLNLAVVVPNDYLSEITNQVNNFIFKTNMIQSFEFENMPRRDELKEIDIYGNSASNGLGARLELYQNFSFVYNPIKKTNMSLFMKTLGWSNDISLNLSIDGEHFVFKQEDKVDGWINITSFEPKTNSNSIQMGIEPDGNTIFLERFDDVEKTTNIPKHWEKPDSKYNVNIQVDEKGRDNYLELTTKSSSKRIWSKLSSPEIPVSSPIDIEISFWLKQNNSNPSHVKILGYNTTSNKWDYLRTIAREKETFNWKKIIKQFHVNEDISTLQLIFNAGTSLNKSHGNGTVAYDDILLQQVVDDGYIDLDVIHLLFSDTTTQLHEVMKSTLEPSLVSYKKEGATEFKVTIESHGPYTIVLRETYDETWMMAVNGKPDSSSIPVYGMLNGFLVNTSGEICLSIFFMPQKWFEIGMGLSIIGFVSIPLIWMLGRFEIINPLSIQKEKKKKRVVEE